MSRKHRSALARALLKESRRIDRLLKRARGPTKVALLNHKLDILLAYLEALETKGANLWLVN